MKSKLLLVLCLPLLLSCLPYGIFSQIRMNTSSTPAFSDFSVNTTQCSASVQWDFTISSLTNGLQNVTFWWNNGSTDMGNTTITYTGGPTSANALFNGTLPNTAQNVTFQCWAYNFYNFGTTGVRWMLVYPSNSSNPYFLNLGTAISTIENANNWTATASDPNELYMGVVLQQNTTAQLQTMIDGFVSSQDWADVLKWSAICNKLGFTQQNDLCYALGNYTMIGSLPFTQNYGSDTPCFCVENEWAVYGYYYANTTWYKAYSGYNVAKWNITAAYKQFNTSVYYAVNVLPPNSGLPLWIFSDNTGATANNRYYDEDANTIECYILFAELLNVSGAMDQALYWWNYLVNTHWTGSFFAYTSLGTAGGATYECEAPFFLEIISILKYYNVNLGNWTDVITDIGNRFLSSEWTSAQWWSSVVLHASLGYGDESGGQRRLCNTLGAWQALLGIYLQFNTTYRNNMNEMLLGKVGTQQAWNLLLQSGLYNGSTYSFYPYNTGYPADPESTSYGEALMWMMGIVPGNTTVAFPLEELNYEYVQEIDPALFKMNCDTTLKQITIPVDSTGTITFQYGCSPITYYFNQAGIWQITFTNSWNNILSASCIGSLPSNVIYFSQTYTPNGLPVHNLNTGLNYATIQEAISAPETLDGHTIEVNAGAYYEHVNISKSIFLLGESRNTTIIDGSGTGPVVTLSASNVSVANFTIRNGGHSWSPQDTCIWGDRLSNVLIENNTVTDVSNGIIFYSLQNSSMSHNLAEECGVMGLHLESSENCKMVNNTVTYSFQGVVVEKSAGNSVQGNNLTSNSVGLQLYASAGNLVEENNFRNSSVGIVLDSCNGSNSFRNNNMASDEYNLIVWGSSIEAFMQNVDTSNIVDNRTVYYITDSHDLMLDPANCPNTGYLALVNCTDVTVKDIDLSDDKDGVLMAQSTNCSLINVTLANAHANITLSSFSSQPLIHGGLDFFKSDNNLITDSRIMNNSVGICLYQSRGNLFYHNMFVEVDHPVISNFQSPGLPPSGSYSVNEWDNGLEGNYWSNYNGTDSFGGPYQNASGSDGIGDTAYSIDANNADHYPLMGSFYNFTVSTPSAGYQSLYIISNSTVSSPLLLYWLSSPYDGLQLGQPFLQFTATGESGSVGFCRLMIPRTVLNSSSYIVLVDSRPVNATELPVSNDTCVYLYFTYPHSTHEVIVTIPEFFSLILPILMMVTLLAVMSWRRKSIAR